jgi:tetratricopeptide (TPR) repeat protein
MPVDWNACKSAYELSRNGDLTGALEVFSRQMFDAETAVDRAALLIGKATCYSHSGDARSAVELAEQAKLLVQDVPEMMLQIKLVEANSFDLKGEHDTACTKYEAIKNDYQRELAEDQETLAEVESRYACALVNANRYDAAIHLLRTLLLRADVDSQWLHLLLGTAFSATNRAKEAQEEYRQAAMGSNQPFAHTALERLGSVRRSQ